MGRNLCMTTKDPTGEFLPGVTVANTKGKDSAAGVPTTTTQTRTDSSWQVCFLQTLDGSFRVEFGPPLSRW